MLDLVNRLECALENPNIVPWFSELTEELAGVGWDMLGRNVKITASNYSTSNVLSANTCDPQNIIARLSSFPGAEGGSSSICVESLSKDLAHEFYEAGISFYTPDEIRNGRVLSCLKDAICILNQVPTLMPTVAALVRILHLIKIEDDDYDMSFSEPHIPFSVFVSIPKRRTTTDALRVAEAIVHEAMHLQLTLIEQVVPLVIQTQKKYYSPWREEYRTAQGILHALYVFRVINRFLEQLAFVNGCITEIAEYTQSRCDQIDMQIREVQFLNDCSELTKVGACFVKRLVQS